MTVIQLGTVEYRAAVHLQEKLARSRARDACGDLLLLVEHPPVITVGRGGGWEDLLVPIPVLHSQGVKVAATDRGGRATYHGPGQLVAYPIFKVEPVRLHDFVWNLEEVGIRLLRSYGLAACRLPHHPGVWLNGAPSRGGASSALSTDGPTLSAAATPSRPTAAYRKIGAVGLAVREGVTSHGIAINVAPHMQHFELLIPCGIAEYGVTSMEQELARTLDLAEVMERFALVFADVFGRRICRQDVESLTPSGLAVDEPPQGAAMQGFSCAPESRDVQPAWLWRRISAESEALAGHVEAVLRQSAVHTVCQQARCPNIAECFSEGTATFMILGDVCTRGCRFCAVGHGRPAPLDPKEPDRVARAASQLGLRHVVITSVTRDDLPDGGASHFAATTRAVRIELPNSTVELLIPDLKGSSSALQTVLDAQPEVLNHNLETVPRLYPRVRPGADYRRSLSLLALAKARSPANLTKSGLMLGLGERTAEVLDVLQDLRAARCDLLTLGQYLQPSDEQLPVVRYVPPAEFEWYREKALAMGFRGVASGPLVRSSHRAAALWMSAAHDP